ncbi:MAG: hypothetical protein HYX45_14125 [Burkholderiales bacterium]|nr:hypothetical protein [Burkholderiales bacterium]MCZ8292452.1 hypothetical protein [Hylemonella sp.]
MEIGGVGAVLIVVGLGILLMAMVTALMDSLPPRSDQLAEIARKRAAGERLTNNESVEDTQAKFEGVMPWLAGGCLLLGLILVAV